MVSSRLISHFRLSPRILSKGQLLFMIGLLIIQPENRDINRFRRMQFNNFSQVTAPYLAAFVPGDIYETAIADEYCQKIPYKKRFDLVAITVNTPNAEHCYEIAGIFRQNGAKIAMGGPHATLMPEEAITHCDYLLAGESEGTWPQFLSDFAKGCPKPFYKADSPPDLKGLPFPRWDLLKRRPMMKGALFATRGCPYNCRYCNLKQIYHNCFRTRPIEEVAGEAKKLKSRFIVFWDDNLFADKAYAKALMRALAPLKKKWAAQATLRDCCDPELLSLAKKAGCLYLFVGLETFSQNSLADAGKAANDPNGYKQAIDMIHSYGIMVQAGIVFGFDSDTKSVFQETLDSCEALGIDGATVSILTPFPKTPIYEQYKKEGRLEQGGWRLYNSKTAVAFKPKNMTAEELFEGYMGFRKGFFSLRSFVRRMRVSRSNVFINFIINFGYWLGVKGS